MIQPAAPSRPDFGQRILAAGIDTHYHDQGSGFPLLMLHGSGPGVSAWANWRLVLPTVAVKLAESKPVAVKNLV